MVKFLASHAGSQAQRERRVGQLGHSITNGSGILRRIWIEPAESAEVENAVWCDRQFELHILHGRPLSVAERGFLASYVGVVRRAPCWRPRQLTMRIPEALQVTRLTRLPRARVRANASEFWRWRST